MHGCEQAFGAEASIVDEAVDRAELVTDKFCERRDRVDHGEVAGTEMQAPFGEADRRPELVALRAAAITL